PGITTIVSPGEAASTAAWIDWPGLTVADAFDPRLLLLLLLLPQPETRTRAAPMLNRLYRMNVLSTRFGRRPARCGFVSLYGAVKRSVNGIVMVLTHSGQLFAAPSRIQVEIMSMVACGRGSPLYGIRAPAPVPSTLASRKLMLVS